MEGANRTEELKVEYSSKRAFFNPQDGVMATQYIAVMMTPFSKMRNQVIKMMKMRDHAAQTAFIPVFTPYFIPPPPPLPPIVIQPEWGWWQNGPFQGHPMIYTRFCWKIVVGGWLKKPFLSPVFILKYPDLCFTCKPFIGNIYTCHNYVGRINTMTASCFFRKNKRIFRGTGFKWEPNQKGGGGDKHGERAHFSTSNFQPIIFQRFQFYKE